MSEPSHAPAHLAAGRSADESDLIIERRFLLARRFAPFTGDVFLDFGCGNGAQTALFTPFFPRVVGVDVGVAPLEDARRRHDLNGASNVTVAQYDGFNVPLRNASVDYAVSFEVLEHVADERRALDELARVIKPGGALVLSVPNKWWIFETHGAQLPLLPWNRVPFFSWLPKRLHDRYARARIYRKCDITRLVTGAGFDIRHTGYITAPMDVIRNEHVRSWLRTTMFRGHTTSVPFLATAVVLIAARGG